MAGAATAGRAATRLLAGVFVTRAVEAVAVAGAMPLDDGRLPLLLFAMSLLIAVSLGAGTAGATSGGAMGAGIGLVSARTFLGAGC